MDEFTLFIVEKFAVFGDVTSKKMFGGRGIYLDRKIIGIIVDGEFYIRAKEIAVPIYRNMGLEQFSYPKDGKTVYMKYFALPEEVLEEPTELAKYLRNTID